MKTAMVMCAAVAATALVAGLEQGQAFSPGSGVARPQMGLSLVQAQDPNALFRGTGVVTEVDAATGALTINHQEIVGLMPAMEMLFDVEPRSLSEGVKPGDRIEFRVEGKTYRIRDIKVIEHAR
jgi:Cu/Ag efflux protein CusF